MLKYVLNNDFQYKRLLKSILKLLFHIHIMVLDKPKGCRLFFSFIIEILFELAEILII